MEDWIPHFRLTGLAIREYLLTFGKGNPYDFYKRFRKVKPTTSYSSIARYFYILRRLGLIEVVEEEPSRHGFPKRYHRIVPGMEDDPRWVAPQEAIYPETRLGRKRYRKWIEEGRPKLE